MTATEPAAAPPTVDQDDLVISVRSLRKHFPIKHGVLQRIGGWVRAVDGVDFDIPRGKTVALVGESGCGKTTLGRCVAGLTEPTDGAIYFRLSAEERDRLDAILAVPEASRTPEQLTLLQALEGRHRIDALPRDAWREFRRNCQIVFQDSFSSLNPRQRVRDIVGRPLKIHREASGAALDERVVELLESVGLGRQHLFSYPHQFSGGQRQRISIARAIALQPEFIVLDEPTSSLDVSVQAQILNLLDQLQRSNGLTYLFVTHDLGVVWHMSDMIEVMYLGQISESGPSQAVFDDPRHPYTEALLAANPGFAGGLDTPERRLAGVVPDPANPPQGCRFHTRCPVVTDRCGWEVDDVLRMMERRPALMEQLQGVERTSAFEAELGFVDEAGAASLVEMLGASAGEAMRSALTLDHHEEKVTIGFSRVEPVQLEVVAPSRRSSCILQTQQDPRPD
jgi:oligopeptide/dipeptide ABC transporter ATP-binding protein